MNERDHVLRLVRAAFMRGDQVAHDALRRLHAEQPREIEALALGDDRLALLLNDHKGRGAVR